VRELERGDVNDRIMINRRLPNCGAARLHARSGGAESHRLPAHGVREQVRVGSPLEPLQLPRNPKMAVASGWTTAFQLSGVTVYGLLDWLPIRPPQIWVICWPFGNVTTTVQLDVAVLPVFVTVTSPWKPPPHSLTFW